MRVSCPDRFSNLAVSCRKWRSSASRGSRPAATCSRGYTCPRPTSGRTSSTPSTSSSEPCTGGTSRRVLRDSPLCESDHSLLNSLPSCFMRISFFSVPKRDSRTIPVEARQCRVHGRRGDCLPQSTREWKIQGKSSTQVSCSTIYYQRT